MMKKYIMDSKTPPQTRGTPVRFARGKPVVATWQPDVDLPVIPTRNEERSALITQKTCPVLHIRNDKKNQPIVRDRPLLKFRDGPMERKIRGTPNRFARGAPPARGEPENFVKIIRRSLIVVGMKESARINTGKSFFLLFGKIFMRGKPLLEKGECKGGEITGFSLGKQPETGIIWTFLNWKSARLALLK